MADWTATLLELDTTHPFSNRSRMDLSLSSKDGSVLSHTGRVSGLPSQLLPVVSDKTAGSCRAAVAAAAFCAVIRGGFFAQKEEVGTAGAVDRLLDRRFGRHAEVLPR